ncbi:MAG: YdcF family protein [Bacteroidota bacterium]
MRSWGKQVLVYFPLAVCLAVTIQGCMFSAKTTRGLYSRVQNGQYDVIVVPGVPFENDRWSRTMKGRVYWSKFLYDRGIAKNIIYSGGAVYSPYYEGSIMALYAAALGIPPEHIYTETRAEHSTENIYYSYKLAKKLGFTSIALATDPFQAKQLRRFIRKKVSDSIAIIPFVIDTLNQIGPGMIDPSINYQQAFKKDFISLTERENARKRWRGTRGRNIDKKAYD